MTQAILDTHEFDRLYSEYKSRFIVIAYALLRDKTLPRILLRIASCFFGKKDGKFSCHKMSFRLIFSVLCATSVLTHCASVKPIFKYSIRCTCVACATSAQALDYLRIAISRRCFFIRMSKKYSGGVWPKCPNCRRRFSLPIVSRIKPISRLPSAMAYRYARSHAKSSDACICYAKTWATTCQW